MFHKSVIGEALDVINPLVKPELSTSRRKVEDVRVGPCRVLKLAEVQRGGIQGTTNVFPGITVITLISWRMA